VLQQEQISFILGKNYLISFQQKSSEHFTDVRDRIEKKRGKIRSKGADFLLFRMLDAIVDNYFEVLVDITDSIEKLEMKLIRVANSDTLKMIEFQKRKLIELRKIVLPLKDVAFQLEKTQSQFINSDNHPYFADLKENCLAVLEEIDANKQILEGMANLYYAIQGQRMNEIMKVLTVVSAIFIPLTFIVGVYGMNFKYMPELEYKYGYYTIVAIMFAISISLLLFFVKRGWLKKK
jgi:magnesium transporter